MQDNATDATLPKDYDSDGLDCGGVMKSTSISPVLGDT
jgi:hypothetical protein